MAGRNFSTREIYGIGNAAVFSVEMLTVLLMTIAVLAVAGLAVLAGAVFAAPWGYQDQDGFHYGFPSTQLVE